MRVCWVSGSLSLSLSLHASFTAHSVYFVIWGTTDRPLGIVIRSLVRRVARFPGYRRCVVFPTASIPLLTEDRNGWLGPHHTARNTVLTNRFCSIYKCAKTASGHPPVGRSLHGPNTRLGRGCLQLVRLVFGVLDERLQRRGRPLCRKYLVNVRYYMMWEGGRTYVTALVAHRHFELCGETRIIA